MEITKNNNVSPQAEAQLQQPAGKAKKKGQTPEFDANLMAMMSSGPGQEGQPGAQIPVQPTAAATQVDLSGAKSEKSEGKTAATPMNEAAQAMQKAMLSRANAQGIAAATAKATQSSSSGGAAVQFPDVESLIQTQTSKQAVGTMTDAIVAGPNQPWSPNWVFGAQKAEAAQSLQGEQSPLAGLMQEMQKVAAQSQGGDEKQISQASQRVNQDLEGMLQALGGELTAAPEGTEPAPKTSQGMSRVGGEAFLGLLNGVSEQSAGSGQGMMDGSAFGQAGQQAQQKALKQGLAANGSMKSTGGLHAIEGGKGRPFALGATKEEGKLSSDTLVGGATPFVLPQANDRLQPQAPVITGNVVPGSMMRDRLTTDTLHNITSTVSDISNRGGNGEMRIRMNPGNLGELMIRVSTEGNHVGLKVQASDPQAKKILEESLNSLKEGLAQQNLSLARVDISVAQPTQSASNPQFGDSNPWQQSQNQANAGQMNQDGRSAQSQSGEAGRDSGPIDLRAARARAAVSSMNSSQATSRDASGRLNVIA